MSVVAVSQRVDVFPELDETRDALDQRLSAFLVSAGLTPVPVPNGLVEAPAEGGRGTGVLDRWLEAVRPSALVLSGGNDIGKCPERDSTEQALLDHAERRLLPVLGICRGMQMMAHWAGANLNAVQGHVKTRHRLDGEISGTVNSYHAYSVADCPEGFDVLARSEDGEIEAIRHDGRRWEGWMWHPEREVGFASCDVRRARALLSA